MENSFKNLKAVLDKSEKLLLISHRGPDGDACGSLLAMRNYLDSLGKKTAIYTFDKPSENYNFLPGLELIEDNPKILEEEFDIIFFFDASDLTHTGTEAYFYDGFKKAFSICLDHHFSNKRFTDLNLIDDKASSTCELVARFFKAVDYQVDAKTATCLLNGILSDTGGFTNGATNTKSMEIAAELIRSGAKMRKIMDAALKNKTLSSLRLWGLILSRLKKNNKYDVVYTYVTENDLRLYQAAEKDLEGFTKLLNVLSGDSMVMFIQISYDRARFSLRTTGNKVDVSKFASFFGGGGHKKAAGFTLKAEIVEKDGGLVVV